MNSQKQLKLPSVVSGDLDLYNLESLAGVELPREVGGRLNLSNLKSLAGARVPDKIGILVILSQLSEAELAQLKKGAQKVEI